MTHSAKLQGAHLLVSILKEEEKSKIVADPIHVQYCLFCCKSFSKIGSCNGWMHGKELALETEL